MCLVASKGAIEPNPCMKEPLQRGLAAALHAVAQPLTLLRARFDAEMIELLDETQLRRSALRSARHVEHLCGLLRSMQRLLEMDAMPAVVDAIEAGRLVESAIEDVGRVLDEAGVLLQYSAPEETRLILADGARMRQALAEALICANDVSKGAGTIELTVETMLRWVVIRVRQREAHCDVHDDRMRLSVAALEANVCSQGGAMEFTASPLSMEFRLRRA